MPDLDDGRPGGREVAGVVIWRVSAALGGTNRDGDELHLTEDMGRG